MIIGTIVQTFILVIITIRFQGENEVNFQSEPGYSWSTLPLGHIEIHCKRHSKRTKFGALICISGLEIEHKTSVWWVQISQPNWNGCETKVLIKLSLPYTRVVDTISFLLCSVAGTARFDASEESTGCQLLKLQIHLPNYGLVNVQNIQHSEKFEALKRVRTWKVRRH